MKPIKNIDEFEKIDLREEYIISLNKSDIRALRYGHETIKKAFKDGNQDLVTPVNLLANIINSTLENNKQASSQERKVTSEMDLSSGRIAELVRQNSKLKSDIENLSSVLDHEKKRRMQLERDLKQNTTNIEALDKRFKVLRKELDKLMSSNISTEGKPIKSDVQNSTTSITNTENKVTPKDMPPSSSAEKSSAQDNVKNPIATDSREKDFLDTIKSGDYSKFNRYKKIVLSKSDAEIFSGTNPPEFNPLKEQTIKLVTTAGSADYYALDIDDEHLLMAPVPDLNNMIRDNNLAFKKYALEHFFELDSKQGDFEIKRAAIIKVEKDGEYHLVRRGVIKGK